MINFFKSGIFFAPHFGNAFGKSVIVILKVKKIKLDDKYLGSPLFTKKSKIAGFDNSLDKMGRLIGWKSNSLTPVGREILAKFILETLHVYNMSTFILFKQITKRATNLIRDF